MRPLLLLVALRLRTALAAEPPLTGNAAKRYEQSRRDAHFFPTTANLDQPLEEALRARWQKLAPVADASQPKTRREWITKAWRGSLT